jgi:hypothetical protein
MKSTAFAIPVLAPAVFVILVLVLLPAPLAAFRSPVDAAGPLTARIDGPDVVDARGEPKPLRVHLESKSAGPLRGTVRLAVVEGWRVSPEGPREFEVEAEGAAVVDFTLEAGDRALSALYPVHAFVEFEAGGKALVAHPILILEARFPGGPRRPGAPSPEWSPVDVPRDGGIALWRLRAHRTLLRVFKEEQPIVQPPGWLGAEPWTRASVSRQSLARGSWREAIGVHPPWFGGRAGTALVELPLRLPAADPLRLRFATAIRDHDVARGEPASDGVTFRARVLPWEAAAGAEGEVIFERHSASKVWEEADVDLGRFAGKAVRLQLEAHPGPRVTLQIAFELLGRRVGPSDAKSRSDEE